MRVQVAIPEEYIDAPVLDSALEAVTRLNESLIDDGKAPLFSEAVNRVRWQAEPPGQEHFDHASAVLARGHGDCDDLAPWHAASLRATGQDPGATAIAYQSGPRRWHAVVQRSDGSLEDPSLSAGMPSHSGIRPASVPLLDGGHNAVVGGFLLRPQIAIRPAYGQVQARADLPWHWRDHVMHDTPEALDYAMTALHQAPLASTALVGAIQGVMDLAEVNCVGSEEHLDRLEALQAAAQGWPYEDLADIWGPDHAAAAVTVIGAFSRACQTTLYLPDYDSDQEPGAFAPLTAHTASEPTVIPGALDSGAVQHHSWEDWDDLMEPRGWPRTTRVTSEIGNWFRKKREELRAAGELTEEGRAVQMKGPDRKRYRFSFEPGLDGALTTILRGPQVELA
jgi:hypothetical protein